MKKKGLALMLAVSRVFTMNAVAFASETTDVVEATEEVEAAQNVSSGNYKQSVNEYYKTQTSWKDGGSVSVDGTTCVLESGTDGVAYYTGKKFKAADLGLTFRDSESNYAVPVKSIKNKSKANSTGQVTFSLKGLQSYKYVTHNGGNVTVGEAKTALKNLKSKLKSGKSATFTAYVAPTYIYDSISADALKNLKKLNKTSVSSGDVDTYMGQYGMTSSGSQKVVYIKTKNSTVKKVQLVYLEPKYLADDEAGAVKYKVKTKNLKKNKDYVISGNSITFDNLDTYSGTVLTAK